MKNFKALPALCVPPNWAEEEARARKTNRVYVVRDPKLGGVSTAKEDRSFARVMVHPRFWLRKETAAKNAGKKFQVVSVNTDYTMSLV